MSPRLKLTSIRNLKPATVDGVWRYLLGGSKLTHSYTSCRVIRLGGFDDVEFNTTDGTHGVRFIK